MADTVKRLGKGSVTTTEVTIYTVPAATTTVVSRVTITNTTGGTLAVTVKLAGTAVISNRAIAPGGFLEWDTGQKLETNDTITIQANASGLTYYITGVEVT